MGVNKSKRPLLSPGIRGTSGSTFAGNVRIAADFTFPTEAITGSSAAQTLADHGVSFITYGTSGKGNAIIIPNPPRAGAVKHIFAINNTTSVELDINTASTSNVFWGTTWNTATISAASTGSPGGTPAGSAYLKLIAHSTSQWAIVPGSTFNWDFSASTGSTATP